VYGPPGPVNARSETSKLEHKIFSEKLKDKVVSPQGIGVATASINGSILS
jgi:hypothetical protein